MSRFQLSLEERTINGMLRKHASAIPDKPFMTISGRSVTFAEADAQCRALARGFAGRGIKEGGRVMIMLPNCLEFMLAWFAATLVGAAAVPMNPALKGVLLELLLKDARPDVIVIHATLADELATVDSALVPRLVAVVGSTNPVLLKPANVSTVAFEELYVPQGPDVSVADDYRRIQLIGYTSGTTGPSKGALLSNAAAFCLPLGYIHVTAMERHDSIYAPLPLFHGQGSRHGVMSAFVMGSHITVDEKFSGSRYWQRAAECKASLGIIVTAFTSVLLAQPERPSDRQHGLRTVFNAKYKQEFEERFGVRTVSAFAMTEVGHVLNTPYPERRPGSVGRVCEDWEVKLVDADDRPVAQGEAGELVCRPKVPHIMMTGYLNKPEVTLDSFRNLWFHTGDVLRKDEDGYFYFLDRKKDRIRRLGENVSSLEVEVLVVANPEVAECAVLPYPATHGEDDIRAVVILHPGSALTADELHAWLQNKLPKFMRPRYIEIVETIPRNGTGKIEKHKLIEQGLGPSTWDAMQVQTPDAHSASLAVSRA
ncbi:MAG: AMP-binding protein [Betaproteobacteria bacterium]|nr:AMP-binding protein [Betaproteobacteria bacterium]